MSSPHQFSFDYSSVLQTNLSGCYDRHFYTLNASSDSMWCHTVMCDATWNCAVRLMFELIEYIKSIAAFTLCMALYNSTNCSLQKLNISHFCKLQSSF